MNWSCSSEDHVLLLGWLREEVAVFCSANNGQLTIDPEVEVGLMLTGLLIGIVPDRGLMHEAEVHIPIPWFIDYGLHARLPDHSSVTHIRPRRGEKRFQEISWRTVTTSQDAKITTAEPDTSNTAFGGTTARSK